LRGVAGAANLWTLDPAIQMRESRAAMAALVIGGSAAELENG
jgi:hypothetical protein